jgi:hypothetical protein
MVTAADRDKGTRGQGDKQRVTLSCPIPIYYVGMQLGLRVSTGDRDRLLLVFLLPSRVFLVPLILIPNP